MVRLLLTCSFLELQLLVWCRRFIFRACELIGSYLDDQWLHVRNLGLCLKNSLYLMKNKHFQFSVLSFGLLSVRPVEETIREYPDGNFSGYDFQLVLPFKHLKHQLLWRKNSSNCQVFTIHYIHLSMYIHTHTHTHKIYHIKFKKKLTVDYLEHPDKVNMEFSIKYKV